MGLFDLFRRRAIRDPVALGAFIDEQSLLLAEGAVRDYSRLRAGADADALLKDAAFAAALRKAGWEAYPRALAMTASVVDAMLRPQAGERAGAARSGLVATIIAAFDRRPMPQSMRVDEWHAARAELTRSLDGLARQQPKTVDALVHDHASFYLAIMPLHPKLAGDDFAALRDALKAALVRIEAMLTERANMPALVTQLAARGLTAATATPE
jgi:hypothetical protein